MATSTNGGSVVNQVQRAYNNFQQLSTEYQEHGGVVVAASTPLAQYGFANGSANTDRPTSLTYPNGNTLGYSYGTSGGMDDNVIRITALDWTGGAVRAIAET